MPKNNLQNNHWLSEEILLSRRIRQGCPISALLSIITTDVLAEHIKQELRRLGPYQYILMVI